MKNAPQDCRKQVEIYVTECVCVCVQLERINLDALQWQLSKTVVVKFICSCQLPQHMSFILQSSCVLTPHTYILTCLQIHTNSYNNCKFLYSLRPPQGAKHECDWFLLAFFPCAACCCLLPWRKCNFPVHSSTSVAYICFEICCALLSVISFLPLLCALLPLLACCAAGIHHCLAFEKWNFPLAIFASGILEKFLKKSGNLRIWCRRYAATIDIAVTLSMVERTNWSHCEFSFCYSSAFHLANLTQRWNRSLNGFILIIFWLLVA